jgi:TRAP-type uncharacterized transport system substrate-binding protein
MGVHLVIYSPAPITTDLHKSNIDLTACLCASGGALSAEIVAMPLPDSINAICALADNEKSFHLPIVTTIDFLPAINRQGPDWHAYTCTNADLKMATALYDVAFGLLATCGDISSPGDLRGRKIGVPAQPSSVRVFTEALLRDGWDILDAVELVDLPPSAVMEAVSSGRIDATTWNIMNIGSGIVSPAIPGLLQRPGSRWIEVDDLTVGRINAANPFKTSLVSVKTDHIAGLGTPASVVKLLSFRQGLAVWSNTPDDVVSNILEILKLRGSEFKDLPSSIADMASWPFLKKELLHPAASGFYRRNGITIV